MKLLVCTMKRSPPLSACGNKGGEQIFDHIKGMLIENKLPIEIQQIRCLGYCEDGPNVSATSTGKVWHKVNTESAQEIIEFCRAKLNR